MHTLTLGVACGKIATNMSKIGTADARARCCQNYAKCRAMPAFLSRRERRTVLSPPCALGFVDQELLVTLCGHPTRTREMRIVSVLGARVLCAWIDAEHDARDVFPRSAFRRRVEQTRVDRQMRAVVVGDVRFAGSGIRDRRIREGLTVLRSLVLRFAVVDNPSSCSRGDDEIWRNCVAGAKRRRRTSGKYTL